MLGFREIRAHRAARAGVIRVTRLEIRVIGLHLLGVCVVALEQRKQSIRRGETADDAGEPLQEIAARHAAVDVGVVEIDDALVHGRLRSLWAGG
jgi:hypothetical protein